MASTDRRRITFEPVRDAHFELLQSWLHEPHWRQWWGDPKIELGTIRDMVEGRDTSRPFLFCVDGAPTGYIQYWFIGHHQGEDWVRDHPWLAELPSETIGVDLSIGRADLLSQGIGARALRLFVERLLSEGHREIIIDPDPANLRAVRAYEKAGFRTIPRLVGRSGDSLIMRFAPDAAREVA